MTKEELSKDILEKYPLNKARCYEIVKINPELIAKIPQEFITIEMLAYILERSPRYFEYIPKNIINNELIKNIIIKNPKLITSIPKKYQNKELWNYALRKYPFLIAYVNSEFVSEEVCQEIVSKHPTLIRYIPKNYATKELYRNAVIANPIIISFMPKRYITQELCNYAVERNIDLIDNIPQAFITQEMRNKALQNLANFKNALLIKYIKEEDLTEEMCIFAVTVSPSLIKYVPKKYINLKLITKLIEHNKDVYIGLIPFDYLNDKDRELIIKSLIGINPDAVEKHIPKKYITKDLAELIIDNYPQLIKMIPEELLTKEMIAKINNKDDITSPKLKKLLDNQVNELNVLKELTMMLSVGGSIESISQKLNIPIPKINEIIESQKETNRELYDAIKNKLLSNQALWLQNMITDCNTLSNIILSLGDINNAFLTREQKIKFAYLYNKYCHNSLEEIYTFSNKYQDRINNPSVINAFFKKVLKYNYLKSENTLIPEKKTILFNNKWLKPFDKFDYFKIKDGIPSVTNQYLQHTITIQDVDTVLNILKQNNIPLNDMIVKESLREFYNNTILDYINGLQQYDSEIISKNKSRD